MIEYNEDIYKELIAEKGLEEQLGYFYEEVGELLQAINKYKRSKGRITKANIFSELIDVQITLDILKVGYGISQDNYKNIMDIKVKKIKNFIHILED
jgi:NTP pyrophosphatase (non-canonical NTP hydrolase)